MDKRQEEFRKRLLSTFKIEAREHMGAISAGLLELEKAPAKEAQAEIVEAVFRGVHSLKGASRAVNIPAIELICQALEDVFADWKRKGVTHSEKAFDTIYGALDAIRGLIASLDAPGAQLEKTKISEITEGLSRIGAGREGREGGDGDKKNPVPGPPAVHLKTGPARPEDPAAAPPEKKEAPVKPRERHPVRENPRLPETVRVSTEKLGSLLLQTEELLASKLAIFQQYEGLRDIASMLDALKGELGKAASQASCGRPVKRNLAAAPAEDPRSDESLDRALPYIKKIEGSLSKLARSARQHNRVFERMVDTLLEDMKNAAMLPFSVLLESLPLLVRDVSHEQGKTVDLVTVGEAIEIDRRILEEMKDPLIHLVRNCVDHGIEKPEERLRLQKPPRANITIAIATVAAGKVEILVSDDGGGIDLARVKKAAVANGIITHEESDAISSGEAISLIFKSGVSTSPIITDISGRGLGLAIVHEKVEKLGGVISAENRPGAGTAFRIILPIKAATFRGVLVQAAGHTFIIPTGNVERSLRVKDEDVKTVENRETILVDGRPLSFARLQNVLELPAGKKRSAGYTQALVLSSSGKEIAFGVDEVIKEQEVLVKGFGKQLSRVRNISGAALPGSGKPVPVLNVPDLMRSAVKAPAPAAPAEGGKSRKSILVAEDSITSRILLKNILESAGYAVKTAVDGIDAITSLKSGEFDLLVSDIEMPRMNGFDLTSRVRSDKKLSEMPVILVTALETREDREKGIEAGANAYIIKSSFSQSNLLEVVKKFI